MLRGSFPIVSSHVVDVSALSISIIVLSAFVVVISMCMLYVSLGSRVSHSIFGLMGSVMLSICRPSCVLYSAVNDVKNWVEDEVVCLSPCMHFM